MKKILFTFLSLLVSGSAFATNVIVQNFGLGSTTAADTHPIVANGSLITSGTGIAVVGAFNTGFSDATLTAANFQTSLAQFNVFGSSAGETLASNTFGGTAVSSNATIPKDGLFKVTGSGTVDGTVFSGKNVYTIVGNGSTLENSTFVAVFRSNSTFASESAGQVEANGSILGATPNGTFLLGSLDTTSSIYYPAGGTATGNLVGRSLNAIQLAPVPEPTVAGLGVLALALVRRRRR
jgi:hypothetical protein